MPTELFRGTVIESTDDHTTIGLPEDVTEYADDELRLMTIARERLRDALDLRTVGGLKGGKARAAKLTPKKRSAIAKKAAAARWKTKDVD